jgi:hypothetical protein
LRCARLPARRYSGISTRGRRREMNHSVQDHLIVGKDGHASLKALKLM